jgi:O-antigen ligase
MKKIFSIDNLFFLAVFSMPLYLVRISFLGLPTNIFELILLVTILIWLLKNRSKPLKELPHLPKLLWMSLFLILIGILLSILANAFYATGFGIFKSWFLIPIVFAYLIFASFKSEKSQEKIFLSFYLSAVAMAGISLVYKIENVLTYDNRLAAFYSSPNYLAMYLAPGLIFGFYFLRKHFFLNIALCSGILSALFLTYSYGTMVSLAISILIMFFVGTDGKKLSKIILSAIILLTVFVGTYQFNQQKISSLFSERSSYASRIMIWEASFLLIKEHPLLGIGPGNFQTSYLSVQKYFPLYLEWAVPQPHNIFLAFWLQTGFLGLLGFLLILYFLFSSLAKIIKNKKDVFLATPLLGFFIYTILHGFTDTPFWKNDLSFLFWVSVFLVASLVDKKLLSDKNSDYKAIR